MNPFGEFIVNYRERERTISVEHLRLMMRNINFSFFLPAHYPMVAQIV